MPGNGSGNGSLRHNFCSQQGDSEAPSHHKLVRLSSAALALIFPCMSVSWIIEVSWIYSYLSG